MTGLEVTRPMFVIPAQAGIQATRDGLREKDLRRVPEEASSRRLVKFYNNSERPHQGCRNMGSRPIVTVRKFIQTCEERSLVIQTLRKFLDQKYHQCPARQAWNLWKSLNSGAR